MGADWRVAEHLLSGKAEACVWGEVDWLPIQGSAMEIRTPVHSKLPPGHVTTLVVRAASLAPEKFRCVLLLDDDAVLRACWNSPHREDGEVFPATLHGHRMSRDRVRFDPSPPLRAISTPPAAWEQREAFQSFMNWAKISIEGLSWTDCPREV